jgi:pilus assembly protein CpaB
MAAPTQVASAAPAAPSGSVNIFSGPVVRIARGNAVTEVPVGGK